VTQRFTPVAALAADQHGVVGGRQLAELGVDASLRAKWVAAGKLLRAGASSWAVRGTPATWQREVMAGLLDLGGVGAVAGRTGMRLLRLDGATADDVHLLVQHRHRNRRAAGVVRSTSRPFDAGDLVMIDGFRCLSAERLILDAPLFGLSRREIEDAIDSAIRLRLVSESRLRARVVRDHARGRHGGRALLEALQDTGGESRLERMLLTLLRRAGFTRPELQITYRAGARTIARVDVRIARDLVVEVAGHATHSSRRQRQIDEQRRTELLLHGVRVITFTRGRARPSGLGGGAAP